MPADVPVAFFSYSREDSEFALRLATDLKAAGCAVWIDQLDIGPGQLWDRMVQEALEGCPSLLLILSPASVNSNNVLDEVSFALDKQKTVIPVLYRDCEIPFRVRRFQHLDFRSDYDRMLQELQKCLHPSGRPQVAAKSAAISASPATAPEPAAPSQSVATPRERAPVPPPAAPVQRSEPVAAGKPEGSRWPIPLWITIPVLVILVIVGIYLAVNRSSQPVEQMKKADRAQGAERSPGNTNQSQALSAGTAEIMGTGLAHSQTSPPCSLPSVSESEFSATDTAAWFFFAFRHGDPNDQWTVDWVEPNGYVHKTNTVARTAAAGRYCFEMKIAGSPAQRAPGQWTVRLNRNGTEVAERTFRINR